MSISRRTLLQASGAGLVSALSQAMFVRTAFGAELGAKAKSVIVLWMNGGPSHIDTWDPKPGTRNGGPHRAIKTRTPGLLISEHLPRMAELSNKLAVVRSLTTKEGNHQRAQYLMRTGYVPNPTVQHPSLGGWVSKKLGDPNGGLPAFVSVGGPSRGAGFLGVSYGPFVILKAGAVPNNTSYSHNVDGERFDSRRGLLGEMEDRFARVTGDPKVEGHRALNEKAVRLMRSPDLNAFDLSAESATVKASFGDTDFGRGCLVASRLVEKGARFVEVVLDGWDTHQNNFERVAKLMSVLDPAMSALVSDLEKKNLLASTLILVMGDFGRTPKINANDGRDHFPACSTAVLAGGGIRGGVVYGETDSEGAKVTKDPVAIADLFATAATLLGMNPHEEVISPIGRPITLTDNGAALRTLIS